MQLLPPVKHSLKYNPSIDGLRGISVLLVLFFHLYPHTFSFGYVGVDIFFILSGFLITQIIITKQEKNLFSFKEFYRNRIRRIFPALITVLSFCAVFGYFFALDTEYENLGKHIKSSSFFYENFRLIKEVGYWDSAAIQKPLLHLWSLSIEEQFYLFWPLLMLLFYKSSIGFFRGIAAMLALFFILPFVVDIDKFYHTFARVWELIFGGFAYLGYKKLTNKAQIDSNNALHVALVLFVAAIICSHSNTSYSPFKTLLITASSSLVLIIVCLHNKSNILSNRVLVFFGLISYPLYLWHYVIISFAYTVFGLDIEEYAFCIALVSVLFSYLTFRFVETYTRPKNSYLFVLFLLLLLIGLGFVGKHIAKSSGFETKKTWYVNSALMYDTKADQKACGSLDMAKELIQKTMNKKTIDEQVIKNVAQSTSSDDKENFILLFGDSHGGTAYCGLAKEAHKKGYQSIKIAIAGILMFKDSLLIQDSDKRKKDATKIRNLAYDLMKNFKNAKKIVIATRGAYYLENSGFGALEKEGQSLNYRFDEFYDKSYKNYNHKELFKKHLDTTMAYLDSLDKEVYYLIENPEMDFHAQMCQRSFFECKISKVAYEKRSLEYKNLVTNIAKKYKNIKILDATKMWCDDKHCSPIKDNYILYLDNNHIDQKGSEYQAKQIINDIIK